MPPEEEFDIPSSSSDFVQFDDAVRVMQEYLKLNGNKELVQYFRNIVCTFLSIVNRTDENQIGYIVQNRLHTQAVEVALHIRKTRLTTMRFERTTANFLPDNLAGTKMSPEEAARVSLVKKEVIRLAKVTARPRNPYAAQRSQIDQVLRGMDTRMVLSD
ncbi:hypothetical protein KJ742_00985 [Patescibacteria group bacterium]|nr:hypothetical protein [Patescibacteria group bacterium]MBU1682498.1 hypothetical protein [Patescibacteria group bacterium]MBU1935284.1 hypothetical protein [Patescibacteria group bacterium]